MRGKERLSREEFELVAREAIDGLPKAFRTKLQNLAFLIRETPTPAQQRTAGDSLLLGLYEGVPYPLRDTAYSNVLPDRITLFKRPLETAAADRAQLILLIQKTVLHEVGHYFGLDEGQLRKAGY